jgi:hypothetical protein
MLHHLDQEAAQFIDSYKRRANGLRPASFVQSARYRVRGTKGDEMMKWALCKARRTRWQVLVLSDASRGTAGTTRRRQRDPALRYPYMALAAEGKL